MALRKQECQNGRRWHDTQQCTKPQARRLRAIAPSTGHPRTRRLQGDRRRSLGVSSATIRNDMAVLEEAGLIYQPHTSAGRVPTDRGYRVFVIDSRSSSR